jgi:hypothetical protein
LPQHIRHTPMVDTLARERVESAALHDALRERRIVAAR